MLEPSSYIPTKQDDTAAKVDNAEHGSGVVGIPNDTTTDVLQPANASLDVPPAREAAARSSVVRCWLRPMATVWRNPFNAVGVHPLIARVTSIRFVANQLFWLPIAHRAASVWSPRVTACGEARGTALASGRPARSVPHRRPFVCHRNGAVNAAC